MGLLDLCLRTQWNLTQFGNGPWPMTLSFLFIRSTTVSQSSYIYRHSTNEMKAYIDSRNHAN